MKIQKLAIKFIVMSLTVFAAFGVFAGSASAAEINGYYEGDDGGAYFIRQIGNKIYWFGEDAKGGFANVLAGTISGNKLTARFWDVPKGKAKGAGEITLEIQAGGATLVKLSSTVPFGMKTLKKFVMKTELVGGVPVIKNLPPEMRSRSEGFSGGEGNLTGAWTTDDLSTYYVREMPNGDVVWVAENNAWGGPGGYAQPAFTHVFIGKKIKGLVTGDWVDVPKGKAKASGVMGLLVKSQQDLTVNNPPVGISATKLWRSLPGSLRGFADLHTHPMVNLGFGGKFIHGAPDVGSLIPADSDCNHNVRAKNIGHALGKDNSTHGGTAWFGIENPCGDNLRQGIIDAFQERKGIVTPDNAVGYPSFKDYPKWNDVTHQKMWIDWVRRSYDGGQRVLIGLAVNNKTLAAGVSGPGDGPTTDKESADLQIKEMKAFIARHSDFMEVALTPADLRRIVAANKMAIILGIEVDDIGNFIKYGTGGPLIYDKSQRLYAQGVRYVFPIHSVDNKFGGTAVYEDIFNLSNYHITGNWWNLKCSDSGEGIGHKVTPDGYNFMMDGAKILKLQFDITRKFDPPGCNKGIGHKNTLGLDKTYGNRVIEELMKRGMLIDIDHMSAKAVDDTIALAEKVPGKYPLVSGHNGLRGNDEAHNNENTRTKAQLEKIGALGGMFGLGSDGRKSAEFLADYRKVTPWVGAGRVSFGSDLNGLVKGARPPIQLDINNPLKTAQQMKACEEIYGGGFARSKTGDKAWNYCSDGVAHYGMLADFLKDMSRMGKNGEGEEMRTNILQNAEMFAQMWEKAVKNGKGA